VYSFRAESSPGEQHFRKLLQKAYNSAGTTRENMTVQINNIKMTGSSVGFGKIIKWSRIEKIIAVS